MLCELWGISLNEILETYTNGQLLVMMSANNTIKRHIYKDMPEIDDKGRKIKKTMTKKPTLEEMKKWDKDKYEKYLKESGF